MRRGERREGGRQTGRRGEAGGGEEAGRGGGRRGGGGAVGSGQRRAGGSLASIRNLRLGGITYGNYMYCADFVDDAGMLAAPIRLQQTTCSTTSAYQT